MRNRVKQATLLLIAALCAGPAEARSPDDRLAGAVLDAARDQGGAVTLDPAVSDAARRFAEVALDGTDSPLLQRRILWEQGVREVDVKPITIVGDDLPADAALEMLVEGAGIDWGRYRHAGVGWARAGDRVAATVLLVARVATFAGSRVVLAPKTRAARLVVTNPLAQVSRRDLVPAGDAPGAFLSDLTTQAIPGTWIFELEVVDDAGADLVALWTVDGGEVEPEVADEGGNTLGLGPHGLGASEESLTRAGGLDWMVGAGEPPGRAPLTSDAEATEKHLRAVLQGRRRAAGQPRLEVHPGVTAVARARSMAELDGTGEARSPHIRLLDAGLTPLAADEVVVVASDPGVAWALLLADPAARALILRPGTARFGLGVGIVGDSAGWTTAIGLLRAELGGADANWRSVVSEHVRRARDRVGLGDLYGRRPLHDLAEEAAREIAEAGRATMSEARRSALIAAGRQVVPDSTRMGVDVLITRDPGTVARRRQVVDPGFAEIGVGVVEVPESEAGFAIVLLLVQR